MPDVTRLLEAAAGGDPHAAADLLPLVYEELRKLAAQRLAPGPGCSRPCPTARRRRINLFETRPAAGAKNPDFGLTF
jgi:ECF sigma factor